MKDINIVIDSQTHKVQFPNNFLGLNAENLQGNINFTFTNGFVNGIARLELSIDCESGFIPNLQNTGDSYTLPILSSLLTSDNIVMQLVIEQTDLITYKLTTDTSINNQKTYYTRSGVEGEYVYTIVENPKVADIGTYYEAQIPIFKTHIFNMTVGESINAANTIPDDYPTWIDTLNSLVGQVNAKIIEMNQALAEVDNLDITATKEGTTTTITITRKDGSQQVVEVEDGKDGVGIKSIIKTGTSGLVDTYTITYTDDSTSTFQVTNGRGIVSIEKTGTVDNVDTYTIYYTNGTTSTYTVTNSTVTNQEFQELQRLVDYNALYANALIKMNNSGTELTINDTAEAPMPMKLGANTEQASTTGANLLNTNALTEQTINGITFTPIYDEKGLLEYIKANGTATGTAWYFITRVFNFEVGNYTFYANSTNNGLRLYSDVSSYVTTTKTVILSNAITTNVTINVPANTILNNDKIYPMIAKASSIENYEPYTGGVPAPNPDYPQDIHTISGDNEIKVENENLLSIPFSQYTANALRGEIPNLKAGTYTFSFSGNLTATWQITARKLVNGSLVEIGHNFNSYSYTFTLDEDTTLNLEIYRIGILLNQVSNIMLNKGSTALQYTPHKEQSLQLNLGDLEYSKIGNYADEFMKPSGKNLFDKTTIIDNKGVLYASGELGDNNNQQASDFIKVKENTQYYCNYTTYTSNYYGLVFYDANKNYISGNSLANIGKGFTTPAGTNYIRFSLSKNPSYLTNLDTLQLEKGSTATEYEPYNNGKWYLKKNVGKVVLNGTQGTYYAKSNRTNTTRFLIQNAITDDIGGNDTNCKSNYFIRNASIYSNDIVGFYLANAHIIYISVNNSIATEVNDFKAWLSTHNTIIDYVLATPQYILLNDNLQSQLTEIYNWLVSYQDQTNISQINNDLPFIINTITCYDLNKLLTRVEILESEV